MELNPFELVESKPLEDQFTGGVRSPKCCYDYLIESINPDVRWTIYNEEQDYQGDLFFFGEDDNGFYYFINIGYGSCSGCDPLQGCENMEELIELRDAIKRGIRKFDSIDEFVEYIKENVKGQYWYNEPDAIDFFLKFKNMYSRNLLPHICNYEAMEEYINDNYS